jgi:hypothetical protein
MLKTPSSPKVRDHGFIPGDPEYGWYRQCSVIVPVREAGQWVGAHCGYPPEEHLIWASARDQEAASKMEIK